VFYKIKDFVENWRQHSEGTEKVLAALTDSSLSQKVGPDDRTLGRVAWHLVVSIPEMTEKVGLKTSGPKADAPLPKTAKEILSGYQAHAKSLAEQIEKNWDDPVLQVEDELYGNRWKRGLTLRILIDHEIHHRGQMTVLMRQAGLKVPGIYGPSREEWDQYGMKPPEI
jgi:uncharacterized damage-inducible protein DinB